MVWVFDCNVNSVPWSCASALLQGLTLGQAGYLILNVFTSQLWCLLAVVVIMFLKYCKIFKCPLNQWREINYHAQYHISAEHILLHFIHSQKNL